MTIMDDFKVMSFNIQRFSSSKTKLLPGIMLDILYQQETHRPTITEMHPIVSYGSKYMIVTYLQKTNISSYIARMTW